MPVVGSNTLQTILTEQDTNNSIVTTPETILLVEQNTTNMIVLAEYGSPVIGVSSSTFLGLTDTPNSYTGQANKLVSVNANETSLVFTTIDTGGNVDSVFGRTGVVVADETDYAAYYATLAQGTLADSALQPNDNVSELNNDAGYITLAQVPPGGVTSVFSRTGAVTAEASDYGSFYATTAQGTLANTALQPNDNVSELVNDSGYITAAAIPADAVPSVFGRTGAITAELNDYSLFYTQPGENISIFNNDAGYITAADIPPPTVPTASDVTYDNTGSGLAATDVQAAIDEIDAIVDLNTAARHTHVNKSVLDGITSAGSGQIITIQERTTLSSALQPGDNITELANDAGYITLAQVPANAPTNLTTGYNPDYVFLYSSTGSDTTITAATSVQAGVMSNTDKVTLDSALQSGDNISELTNDSGYITLAQVPADAVSSVFGRTGDVIATAGDYDAFYYTEAETDSQISASMTTHVNAEDPHPQYLTADDLPETRPAWYTKTINAVNPAFYTTADIQPTGPETSLTATGNTTNIPELLGQWMPPAAYAQAFDFYETALTFQYDIDCTNNNGEIYVEVWLRKAGGDTLLATSDRIPLTSDRQTYRGSLIVPGPVSVEVGDITFSRMYLNKTGGTDPTATLYMEGNNLTRMIITQPIPSYPAPHAFTHEVGGTDQIDHSQIAGAFGYKTHAEIDAELSSLSTNSLTAVVEDTNPQLGGDLDANLHNITFTPATGLDNLPGITSDEVTPLNYMKFGTITEAESGIPGTGVGMHAFANMFYYGSTASSANVITRDFGDRNYLRYTGATTNLNMNNWGVNNASSLGVGNNNVAKILNSSNIKPGTDGLVFVGDTFAISNDSGADIVYYPVSAGASTAGQVLTSDGLGNITFQTPASGGGGAVDSVFGRTGVVTAESGDYATYYAPIEATSYAIDTVQAVSSPASVNIASGGFLTYTATGANTWNFTVPNTAGKAIGWTLELTNGGTGAQTFTGVDWAAGTEPTLVASGLNVLVFTKNNVTGVIRGYVAV